MFKTEDPKGPNEVRGISVEANITSEKDALKIDDLVVDYNEHFKKFNWNNYLAASGPSGSTYGWKKNDKYFYIIMFLDIRSNKMLSAFIRYN